MRIPLIAIALSVAFAGCSDPLPSGDLSSTGHHLVVTGAVTGFDAREFQAGTPDPIDDQQPCPVDDVPQQDPDPVSTHRCARPYTKFTVNFTALPDPLSQSYSLKFVSSSGAMTDVGTGTISGHVHPTTGAYMADDFVFDNSDECDEETSNGNCYLVGTYDGIQLFLGDIHVATAPMGNGAFELAEGLLGASFTVAYEGKQIVLTASGLGNHTYEGWLIDPEATPDHAQKFPVANGENTFDAPMNIKDYSAVHIHVAGTKLNVAVGNIE